VTAAEIAALLSEALPDLNAWTVDAVAVALAAPGAVTVVAQHGVALGRTVAGEAELYAIAIRPEERRRGAGRALLSAWERAAVARGASALFLEVAEDNRPARALYGRAGWAERGRRRGYYGAGRDALVLGKVIGA